MVVYEGDDYTRKCRLKSTTIKAKLILSFLVAMAKNKTKHNSKKKPQPQQQKAHKRVFLVIVY